MKPALSVIFFTVSSGTGLGLLALLVLADLSHWIGPSDDRRFALDGVVALALITAGLLSSTFHLANPKNAWRSLSRFRTSWLSREAVFALALYPVALAYLLLVYAGTAGAIRVVAGVITLLLAWITLYCTGMIYASLKPIPQWHTPLVPVAYVVLGHYGGALLLLALRGSRGHGADAAFLHSALAWLAAAAVIKAIYYLRMRRREPRSTINTATGVSRARVRLLDVGHSHGTFLTDEFGFVLARNHAAIGKILVFVVGFGIPLFALSAFPRHDAALWLAIVAAALGLLLERWFFFAEARHVVRLYHGL